MNLHSTIRTQSHSDATTEQYRKIFKRAMSISKDLSHPLYDVAKWFLRPVDGMNHKDWFILRSFVSGAYDFNKELSRYLYWVKELETQFWGRVCPVPVMLLNNMEVLCVPKKEKKKTVI